MDFSFSDEQEELRETAREFLAENSSGDQIRKAMESEAGFNPGLWKQIGELGYFGLSVPEEYVVGQLNHGFQYISQALDLERFTMFTYSPVKQRLDLLVDHVKTTTRDGEPLKDDPSVRARSAHLATEAEVARGGLAGQFIARRVALFHPHDAEGLDTVGNRVEGFAGGHQHADHGIAVAGRNSDLVGQFT